MVAEARLEQGETMVRFSSLSSGAYVVDVTMGERHVPARAVVVR